MAESRQFKNHVASQLTFQNLQPIISVYQIELAVLVVINVVAHDHFLSFARLRDIVADFLGNVRVGKIDRAQAAAEPGDVKRVAVNLLGGLVRAEAEFVVDLPSKGTMKVATGNGKSSLVISTTQRKALWVSFSFSPTSSSVTIMKSRSMILFASGSVVCVGQG